MAQRPGIWPTREQEIVLLQRMLAGEEAAWREFIRVYGRLLHRCIRRVTDRFPRLLGPDDDEEILANLLLQLVSRDGRRLRLFESERGHRLSTWLGVLATHAAYDHLRSTTRGQARVSWAEAQASAAHDLTPYDEVEQRQSGRIVAEMLSSLSRKDQQFVVLYFHRGLAPEKVAAAMNISVKTVYSKKHKIRTRLEELATTHRIAA